jgi:prepilin peptidase CpaA
MTWAALLLGVWAVVEDLRRRTVPNWLAAAGLAAGLGLQAASGGVRGLLMAGLGAAAGFTVLLPFHLLGGMGGGDVKLMAAFGALLGPAGVLLAALLATMLGGVWAAVAWLCRPRTAAIPFAPAIVLGAWASWFGGGS